MISLEYPHQTIKACTTMLNTYFPNWTLYCHLAKRLMTKNRSPANNRKEGLENSTRIWKLTHDLFFFGNPSNATCQVRRLSGKRPPRQQD